MKKIQLVYLLLISLLAGCASINQTFISKDNDNYSTHGPYGYKSKIYAGVQQDANMIVASCYFLACITAPIGIIDMPFSFVADTLFLPYTVTSNQLNKSKLKKCVENKRKQAQEAQLAGVVWKDDDVWCIKFAS